MNDPQRGLAQHLAELREEFDHSFALPLKERAERGEEFLLVRVGTERYAIGLHAILAVEKQRKIVPLPVQVPGLLGLAGFGDQSAPVFSLASLLGSGTGEGSPGWLGWCKGRTRLALAWDGFEGSVRVGPQDIFPAEPTEGSPHLARQTLRLDSGIRYVIDVPSVVAAASGRLQRG